jgi:hypothetical protein
MNTYKFNDYTMTLKNTWKTDSYGKYIVKYWFKDPNKKLLFSGSDFHASPMHKPESKESAIALLGFLTCKPGDTDNEYFKDYTEDQLNFANSQECENLQYIVYDFENPESD